MFGQEPISEKKARIVAQSGRQYKGIKKAKKPKKAKVKKPKAKKLKIKMSPYQEEKYNRYLWERSTKKGAPGSDWTDGIPL
jgi:hypothetical protein